MADRLVILKRDLTDKDWNFYPKSAGTPPRPTVVPDHVMLPRDAVVVKLPKGKTIAQALAEQAAAQAEIERKADETAFHLNQDPSDVGFIEMADLQQDKDGEDRVRRANAKKFAEDLAAEKGI